MIVKNKRSSWEFSGMTFGNVDELICCKRVVSGVVCLDCILLTAIRNVSFPRGIVAVAIVADSYGATEEAGGPAEVAGAGVGDVVIATDCLLSQQWYWARSCAAHDTVSAVGLVSHTGVGTWTHHVGA